ncbi:MAG TPA: hypothetical protein VGM60_20610 [Pseudonocardia sp.]|uniref:hypothetical protein n=1 Tax=Pseudonocardia sp. TaxID=60912 RepID=UPI002F3E286C
MDGSPVQAWLVLECGTLAADPDAGTLGFGVLEHDATVTTAYPIRIGADGSFTFHRTPARSTQHTPRRVDPGQGGEQHQAWRHVRHTWGSVRIATVMIRSYVRVPTVYYTSRSTAPIPRQPV